MPTALTLEPSMGPVTLLLLVVAGVGTGLVGYLTGLASLVSYPAMLAAGLSPVAANVSQTIGMVGIGLGSTARAASVVRDGSRRWLWVQVVIAAVAGLAGAVALLRGGEESFVEVVPWLVLLAAVAVLLKPVFLRLGAVRHRPVGYAVLLALVCFYGGYFGAGAGTMYLAVSLLFTAETFERSMVLKSLLLAVTNGVSAILFLLLGPVHLLAAVALGLGCLAGGSLGPLVQRRVPEAALRVAVAVAGIWLAWWLSR